MKAGLTRVGLNEVWGGDSQANNSTCRLWDSRSETVAPVASDVR